MMEPLWNGTSLLDQAVIQLRSRVSKELFHMTDTYVIDVRSRNALDALMTTLAIDAKMFQKLMNDLLL